VKLVIFSVVNMLKDENLYQHSPPTTWNT